MKMLKCSCGHVIKGKTVAEVMKKGAAHGKKVHPGMKMTAAMVKMLRSQIKDI